MIQQFGFYSVDFPILSVREKSRQEKRERGERRKERRIKGGIIGSESGKQTLEARLIGMGFR